MINRELMRWAVRRYAKLYWVVLLLGLVGPAAVLLFSAPQAVIQSESHPFFFLGFIVSLMLGVGIFTREYRQGNLLEFILAKPVTRGQFLNTILLAGAAPLLLLMLLPIVYVAVLSPWFSFSLPLFTLVVSCFLAAGWVAAAFLLGIFLGLLLASLRSSRFVRAVSMGFLGAFVGVFINLNNIAGDSPTNPIWQARNYPALSMAVALSAAALLYYAGRKMIEKMDI